MLKTQNIVKDNFKKQMIVLPKGSIIPKFTDTNTKADNIINIGLAKFSVNYNAVSL